MTHKYLTKDMIKEYNQPIGDTDIGKIIHDLYHYQPDVLLRMKPVWGARRAMMKLLKLGHDIVFVTHRGQYTRAQTDLWLCRWFGLDEVRYCEKSKWFPDIDILIDDDPVSVYDFATFDRPAILFTQPWNETTECHGWVSRVYTWREAVKEVKKWG